MMLRVASICLSSKYLYTSMVRLTDWEKVRQTE